MLKVSYESGWGHEAFLHGPHPDKGRHSQHPPPMRKVKQPGPRLSISSFLALSLGWFGKGSEGDALASDLPQICRRFCGRSSEAAVRSFDIAFIDPAFGVRYGKGLCHSFLLCLPH